MATNRLLMSRRQVLRDRAYRRWHNMIQRCTNPANHAWHNYGGRGITVCDEWLDSFGAFYAAVGDAPDGMTLDRIDNDGPYAPENVRWATNQHQHANRRNAEELRTHCPQGHPYDEENTYRDPKGHRYCRECGRRTNREFRARQRAARLYREGEVQP